MADLHDIRATLRETRQQRAHTQEGRTGVTFWVVAACAVMVGFSVVLFTPRLYPVQRTAALPTFQETRDRIEAESRGELPGTTPLPSNPARYAGKSTDEIGKIADEVCFHRAHATQQHRSKSPRLTNKDASDFAEVGGMKHFDALMQCLVTEAPARYCSPRQRQMIAAEIASYFRGIDQANATAKNVVAEVKADTPSAQPLASPKFTHDPKVLSGIEGLIRAGYLTAAERSSIGALAPAPIRERLARVVAYVSPCPNPPWWAVWK
jgi:hypothetical protein